MSDPMYLPDVEAHEDSGARGEAIRAMKSLGVPVPQIMHIFAFKTDRTDHLDRFTQGVMRGPSPLTPGQRVLIAAFTSSRNHCPFLICSHAAVSAELLGDRALVEGVLANHRTSSLSDKDKALFDLIEKVNRDSTGIWKEDL